MQTSRRARAQCRIAGIERALPAIRATNGSGLWWREDVAMERAEQRCVKQGGDGSAGAETKVGQSQGV
jgi:hypothetical protein